MKKCKCECECNYTTVPSSTIKKLCEDSLVFIKEYRKAEKENVISNLLKNERVYFGFCKERHLTREEAISRANSRPPVPYNMYFKSITLSKFEEVEQLFYKQEQLCIEMLNAANHSETITLSTKDLFKISLGPK